MQAYDLTVEHMNNPIGIDVRNPRLSWKCRYGKWQKTYRIRAAASPEDLAAGNLVWSSEEPSEESLNIEYGAGLLTGDRVYWQVRLKDEKDVWGDWWPRCA